MDPSRRGFLRGRPPAANRADQAVAPRPPWALQPDSAFIAQCTRCTDCVRACPRSVLRSGDGGYPETDFSSAGCTLCGDCRRACGTGAIRQDDAAQAFARRVQVGSACLTRHGVECRVCGDACDTRALRFVPAIGGISQLQVILDSCTGCGECLGRCPASALSLAEPLPAA